jgi:hypothetical protein
LTCNQLKSGRGRASLMRATCKEVRERQCYALRAVYRVTESF